MEMDINSALIKNLRAKRLMSQEELAAACGVSLRTIQRIEGQGQASVETLKALASVFEVEHEYLLHSNQPLKEYVNVQLGSVLIAVSLASTVFLSLLLSLGIIDHAVYLPGIITSIVICALFSLMTTKVTQSHVEWHFVLGFWRKSIALTEIKEIERVRNKYWWGLGIRLIPNGWLYCISGLDAVELQLSNGKVLRVGTDNPREFYQAILTAKDQL